MFQPRIYEHRKIQTSWRQYRYLPDSLCISFHKGPWPARQLPYSSIKHKLDTAIPRLNILYKDTIVIVAVVQDMSTVIPAKNIFRYNRAQKSLELDLLSIRHDWWCHDAWSLKKLKFNISTTSYVKQHGSERTWERTKRGCHQLVVTHDRVLSFRKINYSPRGWRQGNCYIGSESYDGCRSRHWVLC